MTTFEVDIDDGMVDVLRGMLPPGWTVDDWLALKGEQAIAQARLDSLRDSIQQNAADGPLTPSGDAPPDALRTNGDGQQTTQQAADSDD